MKEIRCLFSDLDGTLIPMQGHLTDISAHTLSLIHQWLQQGKDFVIATGRDRHYGEEVKQIIGHSLNLIASNGASIIKEDVEVYKNTLSKKRVIKILEALEKYRGQLDFFIQLEDLGAVYHPDHTDFFHQIIAFAKHYDVQEYIDSLDTPAYKAFLYVYDLTQTQAIKTELQEILGPEFTVMTSSAYYIEIFDCRVDKWHGVQKYCELMGYDLDEVITIGDEENDYLMIKNIPNSVAMANGRQHVKEAASTIVNHIDEVLEKHLKKQEL